MNLDYFEGEPELLGGRVRLRWQFSLAAGESPGDVPPVRILRKNRDYQFLTEASYTIYNDAAFPPPQTTSIGLRDDTSPTENGQQSTRAVSIQRDGAEVLRRTTTVTTVGPSAISVAFEVVDADPALVAGTVYYYEMRYRLPDGGHPRDLTARTAANPGSDFGLASKLYGMLPAIYRRHDVATPPPLLGGGAVLPEMKPAAGQLARFLGLFADTFNYVRGRSESLRNLYDLDRVDARLLPMHARTVGWDITVEAPVEVQRHEVRYATVLYSLTGTKPGCQVWIRRLTGWKGRVKEFARNVFFSNDLGNPDDPTDKGSRTVDTENAALLKNIKGFDDDLDYTYDPGQDDDSWYSYNTVGVFLQPPGDASPALVQSMVARLKQNLGIFLPFNIRGVVIVELATQTDSASASMKLLDTGEA